MPGRVAPVKPRSPTELALALNPMKSKDMLAVLAERNQAIVPVGAWVEPASPNSSEISAHTSAYMIEEKLKEQQRKKQEALKHFQRQVKHRVNQQIRLRKKQQLQKSYEAAEKEGCIAMQSSDPAHLTSKSTSFFPSNLNAAIGSSRLPASQMLGVAIKDGENQNELFQQQAQALSQTMKQARHQLASFKTVSKKMQQCFQMVEESSPIHEKAFPRKSACIKINAETREFPLKTHQGYLTTAHYQNVMENQEPDYEETSSVMTDEKRRDLFGGDQQDLLCEDKDKPFSKVQKVKFKNPLFVVMEEDKQKQLYSQGLQDIVPEAQDYLSEAQGDRPESLGDLITAQSVEPKAPGVEPKVPSVEPDTQAIELKVQAIEPECRATELEGLAIKTESHSIMLKAQSTELEDENIALEAQDFLPTNQAFLPRVQDFLPSCQDQDSLSKDPCVLPKDQNWLPTYQDKNFLPEDQDFLSRNQLVVPKEENILFKCQDQDFLCKDQNFLPKHRCIIHKDQNILPKYQDKNFLCKDQNFLPRDQCVFPKDQDIPAKYQDQDFLPEDQNCLSRDQHVLPKDQNILPKCQHQDFLQKGQYFLPQDQNSLPKCQDQNILPKDQQVLPRDQYTLRKCQEQDFPPKDQEKYFWKLSSDLTAERWKKEWPTSTQQYLSQRFQGQHSTREQLEQKEEEDQQEKANLKQPASIWIDGQGREELPLDVHRGLLCQHHQVSVRGKKVRFKEPFSHMIEEKGREEFSLAGYQYLPPKSQFQDFIREQHRNCGQTSHDSTDERWKKELLPECSGYGFHKIQDAVSAREQSLYFGQQLSVGTVERWREDLLLDGHQQLLPRHQRDTCSRRQVCDEYPSGLSTEFKAPFQSGVDEEEDKKERQKQYLRHRRLFMDIEREQVKQQKRQKEQKKKIEKIKKKKEQQRYAEEQRILRMHFHQEPHSEEKISDILAQLQLEEIKGAREKQQQREKEYIRYVEALRAQVLEKMKLYNITLPPLCYCGPDFWDAHPDTCANNCIFYKNHRAYYRALHSVINSSDISEGNSTLRNAIHNFASAHSRTLKKICNKNLKSAEATGIISAFI